MFTIQSSPSRSFRNTVFKYIDVQMSPLCHLDTCGTFLGAPSNSIQPPHEFIPLLSSVRDSLAECQQYVVISWFLVRTAEWQFVQLVLLYQEGIKSPRGLATTNLIYQDLHRMQTLCVAGLWEITSQLIKTHHYSNTTAA